MRTERKYILTKADDCVDIILKSTSLTALFDEGFGIDEAYNKLIQNDYSSEESYYHTVPFPKMHHVLDPYLLGIDLPVFVNQGNPIIAVVGEDPRRDSNDEKVLSFGTPYGIHSSCIRNRFNMRPYYAIFDSCLSSNFTVYLTDVSKIYLKKSRTSGKTVKYRDSDLLKDEIETVSPKGIITLGKVATQYIKDLALEIPCQPLPHPAGSNARDWSKDEIIVDRQLLNQLLEKHDTINANCKSEYVAKKVDEFLKTLRALK